MNSAPSAAPGPDQVASATVDLLSQTLARAFHTDPMQVFAYPDPQLRRRALRVMFRAMVLDTMRNGIVDHTPDGRGVALWRSPDQGAPGALDYIRAGMWRLVSMASPATLLRLVRLDAFVRSPHGQVVPEPHYYLHVLGVDPEHQGHRLGSALLTQGLARADAAGLPAYLETLVPINVRIYSRFGFEVALQRERYGITTYHLVRPAGATRA